MRAAGFSEASIRQIPNLDAALSDDPELLAAFVRNANAMANRIESGQAAADVLTADRAFSGLVSMVPVVGTIKDALEAETGVDAYTGEELGTFDRVVSGVAAGTVVLGLVVKPLLKAARPAAKAIGSELKQAASYVDKLGEGVGDLIHLIKTNKGGYIRPSAFLGDEGIQAGRIIGTHKELVDEGIKDSHHIIQHAAARDIPGYDKWDAPTIQLESPSNVPGTEHYLATQVQKLPGGGTYAAEREIAERALRVAGVVEEDIRRALQAADDYFSSLGVTPDTVMRIPGDRPRP